MEYGGAITKTFFDPTRAKNSKSNAELAEHAHRATWTTDQKYSVQPSGNLKFTDPP